MNATIATIAPAPHGAPHGAQHMRALERANQVRLARASVKRRIATGELDVVEVILECPWETRTMAIADLLASQRRWGLTRCRKFLASIPLSERKPVGALTERQRHALATMLIAERPRPTRRRNRPSTAVMASV
jgi:hypothetical protein